MGKNVWECRVSDDGRVVIIGTTVNAADAILYAVAANAGANVASSAEGFPEDVL